ncbi:hypothetical protein GIB67_007068 [Kingdonia uniflora]|uniref:RRM domain-containing protein n=1 Tax=Kingdonia uniflora TaxID=39325 RepID=A0A7J7NZD7_9MAGN|nr:hypothetical protein GIB67_007068 [Kingdonia uniflora]
MVVGNSPPTEPELYEPTPDSELKHYSRPLDKRTKMMKSKLTAAHHLSRIILVQPPKLKDGFTLCVQGIGTSTEYAKLRASLFIHFWKYGEISRMRISRNYKTVAARGVAFIEFEISESVAKALMLDSTLVDDRIFYVDKWDEGKQYAYHD